MPRDFVPKHMFSSASCVSGGQAEGQQRHKPLTSTERSQLLSDQPGGAMHRKYSNTSMVVDIISV